MTSSIKFDSSSSQSVLPAKKAMAVRLDPYINLRDQLLAKPAAQKDCSSIRKPVMIQFLSPDVIQELEEYICYEDYESCSQILQSSLLEDVTMAPYHQLRLEKALNEFTETAKSKCCLELAYQAISEENFELANVAVQVGLKSPASAVLMGELYVEQGKLFMLEGRFPEAIFSFEKAFKILEKKPSFAPTNFAICKNLGKCFIELKRFDLAKQALLKGKTFEIDTEEEPDQAVDHAWWCYFSGVCFWNEKAFAEVKDHLLQADLSVLELFADDDQIAYLNLLGSSYLAINDSANAIYCFKNSIKMCKPNSDLLRNTEYLLALAYKDSGNYEMAIAKCQELLTHINTPEIATLLDNCKHLHLSQIIYD